MEMAQEQALDLVEIAPNADPPVCKIMDYGKFLYEKNKKERDARKNNIRHNSKKSGFALAQTLMILSSRRSMPGISYGWS